MLTQHLFLQQKQMNSEHEGENEKKKIAMFSIKISI